MSLCGTRGVEEMTVTCIATQMGQVEQSLGELELLSPSQRLPQLIKQTSIEQTSRWQEALCYYQVQGLLCCFKRTTLTVA
jgi:hypothetical protein